MENSLGMRVLHGARDFGYQPNDFPRVIPKSSRDVHQTSAGCELHAEERQAIVAFAYFVDRQNVWMIETGCGFGFAAKTGERLAGIGVKTQNPLQRDNAP